MAKTALFGQTSATMYCFDSSIAKHVLLLSISEMVLHFDGWPKKFDLGRPATDYCKKIVARDIILFHFQITGKNLLSNKNLH